MPVPRSRRAAKRSQRGQLNLVQDSCRLVGGGRRSVVSQRHPRGDDPVVGSSGVTIVGTVLTSKSAEVLTVTAAGQHRVDMHGVDHAGDSISGSGIRCGPLRQQDHHGGLARRVLARDSRLGPAMGGERDTRRRGMKSSIEPEIANSRGIFRQQWANGDVAAAVTPEGIRRLGRRHGSSISSAVLAAGRWQQVRRSRCESIRANRRSHGQRTAATKIGERRICENWDPHAGLTGRLNDRCQATTTGDVE